MNKTEIETSDFCADRLIRYMTNKENNIEFFRICVLRICYNIITTLIVSAHLFGSHLFVGATNCLYSGLINMVATKQWLGAAKLAGNTLNIFFLSGIYSGHREKSVHLPINLYPSREVCTSLIYLIIKSIKLSDILNSKGCWFVCSCYWLGSCTCS